MPKLTSLIAVAALLAAAAPAANADEGIPYKGKTSGGHKVTFTLTKGKLWNFATGVPVTCLPIQGGGAPMTGVEPWTTRWVRLGLKNYKRSDMAKPALYYNEVTMNHTVSTRRGGRGAITGSIRVQYEFLIPKYPIGTFSIYSCLGSMEFSARPAR